MKEFIIDVTVSETRKVKVSSHEIIKIVERALKSELHQLKLLNPNDDPHYDISGAEYINHNGEWEYWENGHGSGYTTVYRKATEEEKQLDSLISESMRIIRKQLSQGD